jgi:hypothetical protein
MVNCVEKIIQLAEKIAGWELELQYFLGLEIFKLNLLTKGSVQ